MSNENTTEKSTTKEKIEEARNYLGLSGLYTMAVTSITMAVASVPHNAVGWALGCGIAAGFGFAAAAHNYANLKAALNVDLVERMQEAGIGQPPAQAQDPVTPIPTEI